MAALATADDLIARYDERDIRDLVKDDGTAASGSLTANTLVLAALTSASGHVLAAAANSQNYTETDLAALTGNAQALLVDIVCQLAMVRLHRRRANNLNHEVFKALNEEAEAYLDMLRKGQRIFPVEAHQAAGLPTIGGPTAVDYERMNLITSRTKHFYPSVASRLPLGRG